MLDPLSINIATSAPRPEGPIVVKPARKLLRPSPDHPDDYILEVDYSSISEFMRCPRAAENKLIHSREATRESTATAFGGLFHRIEELRLRHGMSTEVRTAQLELIATHFLSSPVAIDEYRNAARMVDLTDKYNKLYATDGWPDRVLKVDGEPFVERPFKIELCTIPVNTTLSYSTKQLGAWDPVDVPFIVEKPMVIRNIHVLLTGRIDCILSNSSLLWVVDHKTTSRGGKEYEEAFFLSLQTRGYCWAAHKLGIPVAGLLMNAVICRPLTKTGVGTEFHRPSYFYSLDSLAEYETNMRHIVSDFIHSLVRGFFPQTARSFKSPCASCDYQDNCRLPSTQRAADLASSIYRDVTWDPIGDE